MAEGISVSEKVAETVGGMLEKLTNTESLILGLTAIIYLDLWLINFHVDILNTSFEGAATQMRGISVGTVLAFIGSYSLFMSAAFPWLRMVYSHVWKIFLPRSHAYSNRNAKQQRFTDRCFALVCFAGWDAVTGYWSTSYSYRGLVYALFDTLSSSGVAITVLRVSTIVFAIFCFLVAAERDV